MEGKYQISPKITTLCKKLDIKIKLDRGIKRAMWIKGKTIIINPKTATNYDILHEISHSICGHGCCREHCEFEAHGGAKVLCRLLSFSKGNSETRMDSYAGWSSRNACGRINPRTTKKQIVSKFIDKYK